MGNRKPDGSTRPKEGKGVDGRTVDDPLSRKGLGFYEVGWARVMKKPRQNKPKKKEGVGLFPEGGPGGGCKISNRTLPRGAGHQCATDVTQGGEVLIKEKEAQLGGGWVYSLRAN